MPLQARTQVPAPTHAFPLSCMTATENPLPPPRTHAGVSLGLSRAERSPPALCCHPRAQAPEELNSGAVPHTTCSHQWGGVMEGAGMQLIWGDVI
jgi:hypothetical protein